MVARSACTLEYLAVCTIIIELAVLVTLCNYGACELDVTCLVLAVSQ